MLSICSHFRLEGTPILCSPFGGGHINRTYLVVTNAPRLYILQCVNGAVFKDAPGLMGNIAAVCAHLQRKVTDPRHAMNLVPTLEGDDYILLPDDEINGSPVCWRVFDYVPGGVCLDLPESPEDLRQTGAAFGMFQNQLADFPAHTLVESIPHFHDTPDRFRQLHQAINEDRSGRLQQVQSEAEALLRYEEDGHYLADLLSGGRLPLRVTHNDTKLNNVMLDEKTRTPLCVMDLDTVMPGLIAHDFGDAIRTGACTAAEDEQDLTKVGMSMPMYRAFTEGFLGACGRSLTPLEVESLPWGAKLMTLECAVRFMTDHLNGDIYFRVHRENHNLDRCRTQLALLRDMERQWDDMFRVVREVMASLA